MEELKNLRDDSLIKMFLKGGEMYLEKHKKCSSPNYQGEFSYVNS